MKMPADKTRALVREIAERYGVSVQELTSKRGPRRLLRVRIEIAERLRARGLSNPQIGRIMQRDHTTVDFYLGGLTNKKPSPASLALMPVHPPAAPRLPSPPKPPPKVRYAGWDRYGHLWRIGNKTTTT